MEILVTLYNSAGDETAWEIVKTEADIPAALVNMMPYRIGDKIVIEETKVSRFGVKGD